MCTLGFGSYFCYDNPGALQDEIKSAMDISTYQFENLYAFYSWPNVFLPIIGGYLLDNVFGIRLGAVIFASFILAGQLLTSLGAFVQNFKVMEFSRFVFGIGGESLAVAQNTYASVWFRGAALNMVFGLQTSIARVGSTVNFQVVGPLYREMERSFDKHQALGWTLLIAGITTLFSLIGAIILGLLDKRRERLTRQGFEENPKIALKDVLVFPLSFWLVCLICVTYYVAVFPFVTLGQVYFMKKYSFSDENANFITGLVYLISAFAAPLFGIIIDRVGRNVGFVFMAVLATLLSHIVLVSTDINPYVSIILMGIGYSMLAAALWPIVALIVPHHRQGTAFGLMQAIQNLGLAVISLLAGLIVDNLGYMWLELFFIFWLLLATTCTITIWLIDSSGTGYLNMSKSQRKEFDSVSQLLVEQVDSRTNSPPQENPNLY